MKRVGFLMEKISDLDNLYLAYRKSIKGKRRKVEVRRFAEHLDSNLSEMRRDLIDGTIAVGDYRYFTIYDPKKRTKKVCPDTLPNMWRYFAKYVEILCQVSLYAVPNESRTDPEASESLLTRVENNGFVQTEILRNDVFVCKTSYM